MLLSAICRHLCAPGAGCSQTCAPGPVLCLPCQRSRPLRGAQELHCHPAHWQPKVGTSPTRQLCPGLGLLHKAVVASTGFEFQSPNHPHALVCVWEGDSGDKYQGTAASWCPCQSGRRGVDDPTLCPSHSLDQLLDSGLYTGEVTELMGAPGSGKTQVRGQVGWRWCHGAREAEERVTRVTEGWLSPCPCSPRCAWAWQPVCLWASSSMCCFSTPLGVSLLPVSTRCSEPRQRMRKSRQVPLTCSKTHFALACRKP